MGQAWIQMNSTRSSKKHNKKRLIITAIFFLGVVFFGIKFGKYLPFVYQLIFNKDIQLKKNGQGRINILLLGIGGGTHDGPNLSDSMIFASIDPIKNKVTLISIPRDLWVSDINNKINAAYAFGEEKQKALPGGNSGGGLILAKAIVTKITGQEIDYGVRIDFDGFVKAVDVIGGLDINVENAFDDYEYPIEGKENDPCGHSDNELISLASSSSQLEVFPCRYMHVHFAKGLQHMDGQTALRFVRSRHAEGEEGTDFARSKRQEKIIKVFKDKTLSLQTLINPTKVISLYNIVKTSLDTDIKQDEFDDFIRLFQKIRGAKVESAVIDYGDPSKDRPGLLKNPPLSSDYNFAWVLIPRIGVDNYSEIQNYIDCEIRIGNCNISKNPDMKTLPSK